MPDVVTREEGIEFTREDRFRPFLGVDERTKDVAESHQGALGKHRHDLPSIDELQMVGGRGGRVRGK